jgi:hypothetical protein
MTGSARHDHGFGKSQRQDRDSGLRGDRKQIAISAGRTAATIISATTLFVISM